MLLSRTLRAAVLAASCLFAGAALAQPPAVPPTATAPRVLGSPDAPVEVIEYASLTCHHCASFHNDVLPQVQLMRKWAPVRVSGV
jgi:protein-disulfide isomerase